VCEFCTFNTPDKKHVRYTALTESPPLLKKTNVSVLGRVIITDMNSAYNGAFKDPDLEHKTVNIYVYLKII
jgi:hypothetical protein